MLPETLLQTLLNATKEIIQKKKKKYVVNTPVWSRLEKVNHVILRVKDLEYDT